MAWRIFGITAVKSACVIWLWGQGRDGFYRCVQRQDEKNIKIEEIAATGYQTEEVLVDKAKNEKRLVRWLGLTNQEAYFYHISNKMDLGTET